MTTNDQFVPPQREIVYSREDHDYSAYLDGEYVGLFKSHLAAEAELNRLALDLINFAAGWNAAVRLGGNE